MYSHKQTMLGLALLFGLHLHAPSQAAEIVPVEVSAANSQAVLGSTVTPYKTVTLSAQIPGVVKQFSGEVGSAYRQGDLLVQIDDAQVQAKRNAVLARIQSAQSGLANAQAQLTREQVSPRSKNVEAMPGFGMPAMFDMMAVRPFADSFMGNYNSDTIRASDLQASSAAVAQAQGEVQQANAQLQEIDSAVGNAKSVAPFEGIILSKQVEVGDTVQPGQPLLTYAYLKSKRLQSDVPSGLVGNLKEGLVVAASINGGQDTLATVAEIYPVADPNRHTVTVKFDLPSDVSAPPGTYAEIHLPDSKGETSLFIPQTALLVGGSLPTVLVVKDGSSQLRMVRLGGNRADGKVEVISGLTANEHIIDHPPTGATSGWMPPVN